MFTPHYKSKKIATIQMPKTKLKLVKAQYFKNVIAHYAMAINNVD